MIEECIALEIQAAKKEESQLIMDLFPAIGTSIQKLQGIECNEHLQTVNALKMMPTLLQYGPIENINNFLIFYQTHHCLDDVPNPTIRTLDDEYPTVEERTNAMHTVSLQRTENKGIQLYMKYLESILITPTACYNKQVEEIKWLLNLKKLSNEVILDKSTEDTAMELDGEGATNYEQLKDLIQKECDKQDCKYAQLEDKYNKLEQQVTHKDQQKNMAQRGRRSNNEGTGALKKNKSVQKQSQNQRNNSLKNKVSGNQDQPKQRNSENQGKAAKKQRYMAKQQKQNTIPLTNQIKSDIAQINWQEKNTTESVKKKLTLQFGFVAKPSHSSHHNASNVLADTPTWYHFSRPSHLAFHDFTKNTNHKKPTLTAGSGTQVHPNTNLNKILDTNMIEIVQPPILICTPSIPFHWQTTK